MKKIGDRINAKFFFGELRVPRVKIKKARLATRL
jgi:hypothetical protein